jgi:uncharacterized protein (DUF3084 family)
MLERYLKASQNDTVYIINWVTKNRDLIDEEWKGYSDSENDTHKKMRKDMLMTVIEASGTVLAIAVFLPIGVLAMAYQGYSGVNRLQNIDDYVKGRDRKNWTLLEFAIADKATEVAVILISNGATVTSHCKILLEIRKSNFPQHVDSCLAAIIARAKNLSIINDKLALEVQTLKNEKTLLTKQIQDGLTREHQLKNQLNSAQSQQTHPASGAAAQPASQVNQLQTQITQLGSERSKLELELSTLKSKISDLESELKSEKSTSESLKEKNSTLEKFNDALLRKNRTLEKEVKSFAQTTGIFSPAQQISPSIPNSTATAEKKSLTN